MSRIPITTAMRTALEEQIARTGVNLTAFFRDADDVPPKLNLPLAGTWLYGPTKTAHEENWHWFIGRYEELPDAPKKDAKPKQRKRRHLSPTTSYDKPYLRVKPERRANRYIAFTAEMHSNFLNELNRTGVKLSSLARACSGGTKKLTVNTLSKWKLKTVERVPALIWERVMNALTKLPDSQPQAEDKKRVVIEPEL